MILRAIDLFCGAGGATKGLQRAGFHVTGVDINPQPRYCGDEFHQADAMEFPLEGYDFIWASPPCQAYSRTACLHPENEHPDLVDPARGRIEASGIASWVIENVIGAPLRFPLLLCGMMFGLRVYRHRIFECSRLVLAPPHPRHREKCGPVGRAPRREGEFMTIAGHWSGIKQGRAAMGIDWMGRDELSQAIPPAYSEFIARALTPSLPLSQKGGEG